MDVAAILDTLQSHALASGLFERVNGHEPKSAPGRGLTAALWVQRMGPVAADSGLDSTAGRLEFRLRIFTSMLQQPLDAIDPAVIAASDALIRAYSANFQLGGQVQDVDLLGTHGDPLMAIAGYLTQDQKTYRIMDLTIPLILDNLWPQSP